MSCDGMNPECIDRLARIEGKIDVFTDANNERKKEFEKLAKDIEDLKKFMWKTLGAVCVLTPICGYFAQKLMS